jgi:2-polyprenyl-3-methyl-5-hydroxy-6-metoxy-1,4-benzoquinol methylase
MSFDPVDYWNNRLDKEFNLRGVGHTTFSNGYNHWLYARKDRMLKQIFACLPENLAGKEVLDIGCGTGFFVKRYLDHGANVTGVDISRKSIAELQRKHPESTFRELNISTPEGHLPGRYFDVINMWDVMYHIVDDIGFAQACQNIAAMSKPGSRFVVTDLFASDAIIRPAEHVAFRTRREYAEALGKFGFVEETTLPLYRFLNRSFPWPDAVTNLLAPVFFALDNVNRKSVPYNLCVSVWECRKGKS